MAGIVRDTTDRLLHIGVFSRGSILITRDEDHAQKEFDLIWDSTSETYGVPVDAALWAEGFPPDA